MNDGDKEEKNKKVEFGFPKEGIIDEILTDVKRFKSVLKI